jgi:parallel beta-helix repeat protein
MVRTLKPSKATMRQLAITLLCLLAAACSREGGHSTLTAADAAFQAQLQEQIRGAKPGTVILIPPGTHPLEHALTVRANRVTVRGAGMDRSILSFKGAPAAPAAILVEGNGFAIDGVTIQDSTGDGLAINGDNLLVHAVQVAWTQGPRSGNGAYGIRLEAAHNARIEDSVAYSASAAGIYLVKSANIIVRRCHIEQSVTGIAVSDAQGADIQDSLITGNSAGILIANTPGAAKLTPSVRIFGNKVYKNNLPGFAAAGSTFAGVPAGAGVVVNSGGQVEIFDNDIANNQTANILISAYWFGTPGGNDASARSIFIYGNRFAGGGYAPLPADLKGLRAAKFGPKGRLPDIVWDGYQGGDPAQQRICIDNAPATVLDADAPHAYQNPNPDPTPFRCELPKLPAARLTAGP